MQKEGNSYDECIRYFIWKEVVSGQVSQTSIGVFRS